MGFTIHLIHNILNNLDFMEESDLECALGVTGAIASSQDGFPKP